MANGEVSIRSVSIITNYFALFEHAFQDLGKEIQSQDVERLSVELVRAMGSELRDYHKPEHSLDVSKNQTAIGRLAGVFHDCVYVQVDPSWKTNFSAYLSNFLPGEDFKINAKIGFAKETDPTRKAIIILFGMDENPSVTSGTNEVLSALVMQGMLSKFLTSKEIISVAACIEATIPFRRVDADGRTPADRLHIRLNKAASILGKSFSEQEKSNILNSCRGIVEKDLGSFASKKFNTFISNTWNVMNENNQALRNTFFYVSEYRKAVYAVIPFLKSLDPEQMFWDSSDGADLKIKNMISYTNRNLKWGVEYLEVVGLSLALVESIALETGGDLPYETLVGPLRKGREHLPESVGAFLSSKDFKVLNEEEREIYLLLKNGRDLRARFDRKECPIGSYLYQNLSQEDLQRLFESAHKACAGEIMRMEFLKQVPSSVLTDIISALARASIIRTTQFQEFLIRIQQKFAA